MKPYMTPARFRIGGYGVSLDAITDAELSTVLQTATTLVNGYCTVPTQPAEYDFRGGTVVGEEYTWELGHELLPPNRYALSRYTPIVSVEDFRIDVTNTQYLGFTSDQLYLTDSTIQIVSPSTSGVGLFGNAVIPAIGLIPPIARWTVTYGHRFVSRGEEIYPSDALEYRALNQWWYDDPEPVVYVDGTEVNVGDYTVDTDEGTITFDTGPAANAVVTVDYDHRMPSAIAEGTAMIAVQRLGERNLTSKGLHGLIELAVGDVRLRRDFPRAGVAIAGISAEAQHVLDPYKFVTVRGS